MKLYCETCRELICYKCALKGGKHQSHDYEEIEETFKREIAASVQPLERQLTTINKALAGLDTRCKEISNQQAAIEANIDENFRQFQKVLEARKTELICHLQHKIS